MAHWCLRPSCRARQRRCEWKESGCSHAVVAARARRAARGGGTRPHSILPRQARSSMRARLATRCTTRRHGRRRSQGRCSTTCCRSWWRSSTASIACAAAAPRTAPVKPARAPPAHGPTGDATHRCLHEQLLAAEAARGTLVLDVQNVRDHVRSRAARPETRPPARTRARKKSLVPYASRYTDTAHGCACPSVHSISGCGVDLPVAIFIRLYLRASHVALG